MKCLELDGLFFKLNILLRFSFFKKIPEVGDYSISESHTLYIYNMVIIFWDKKLLFTSDYLCRRRKNPMDKFAKFWKKLSL